MDASSARLNLVVLVAVLSALGSAAGAQPLTQNGKGEVVRCHDQVATLVGTSADDVLRGTPERDVIHGSSGDDLLVGLGGGDILCGGRGADVIKGSRGRDLLDGGVGRDRCVGGPGNRFRSDFASCEGVAQAPEVLQRRCTDARRFRQRIDLDGDGRPDALYRSFDDHDADASITVGNLWRYGVCLSSGREVEKTGLYMNENLFVVDSNNDGIDEIAQGGSSAIEAGYRMVVVRGPRLRVVSGLRFSNGILELDEEKRPIVMAAWWCDDLDESGVGELVQSIVEAPEGSHIVEENGGYTSADGRELAWSVSAWEVRGRRAQLVVHRSGTAGSTEAFGIPDDYAYAECASALTPAPVGAVSVP